MDGNFFLYSWIVGYLIRWKIEWIFVFDCNVVGYCGFNVFCNNGFYVCFIFEDFEFVDFNDCRFGCKRIMKLNGNLDVMVLLGIIDYVFCDFDVFNKIDEILMDEC